MSKDLLKEELEFVQDSGGRGKGTWFFGKFLYFDKALKRSLIILERARRELDKILTIFFWLIVFSGWFVFLYWAYLNIDNFKSQPLDFLFFWVQPNILITFFLLSLWFDLFLIYRYINRAASAKKINYRLFKEKKKDTTTPKRYNIARTLSESTLWVMEDAFLLANKLHHPQVDIIHFFRASLKNKEIQSLFIRLDIDADKLVNMIDRQLLKLANSKSSVSGVISDKLQKCLILAFLDAFKLHQPNVDITNVVLFFICHDEIVKEILYELEIDEDKIINTVAWFRVNELLLKKYNEYRRLAIFKPSSGMNRSYTAIATPTLDHFSYDLTLKAKNGSLDLCVGRDQEIKEIFENFMGGHNGVLLVGPNGVGKSTIVAGLAQMMVAEDVPKFFKDKRLVEIDVSRLVSGVDATVAQDRLLTSINEANRSGNIILYLDNIENIIGITAGSQESFDLSEVLAESINRRLIFCIATTDTDSYSLYIENKSIGLAMTTIGIQEPVTNKAIQILESRVGFLETKYDIYIVYSAIEQAVKMSLRYLSDKALPLKAINLLEKAASLAAKTEHNQPEEAFCSQKHIAKVIEEKTGIPASKVSEEESSRLLNLEKNIRERLIGQEEAVKAVSASLRRARVAMKDSNRPIASFLFLGPTGVGKTELAKTVSRIYFGSEDYMVRLDMSEYQQADSVNKMIGDTNGGLGYLTEAVRKKPFSLILLDEIEKANVNILNLFLQLLDDGRLTDGQGRTINFSESIIIATSNIGANFIQDKIKEKINSGFIKQELIDNHLREYMRPELINRFDGIIVFNPLTKDDIFKIATLMLKKIKKDLLDKGIYLKADKDGVNILAQAGYDPKFGARPLRRLLQERVEDPIANKILSGDLKRRDIVIINNKAEILIEKAAQL